MAIHVSTKNKVAVRAYAELNITLGLAKDPVKDS